MASASTPGNSSRMASSAVAGSAMHTDHQLWPMESSACMRVSGSTQSSKAGFTPFSKMPRAISCRSSGVMAS